MVGSFLFHLCVCVCDVSFGVLNYNKRNPTKFGFAIQIFCITDASKEVVPLIYVVTRKLKIKILLFHD